MDLLANLDRAYRVVMDKAYRGHLDYKGHKEKLDLLVHLDKAYRVVMGEMD